MGQMINLQANTFIETIRNKKQKKTKKHEAAELDLIAKLH